MLIYSVILRDITFDNNMHLRVFKRHRPEQFLHNANTTIYCGISLDTILYMCIIVVCVRNSLNSFI